MSCFNLSKGDLQSTSFSGVFVCNFNYSVLFYLVKSSGSDREILLTSSLQNY